MRIHGKSNTKEKLFQSQQGNKIILNTVNTQPSHSLSLFVQPIREFKIVQSMNLMPKVQEPPKMQEPTTPTFQESNKFSKIN